MRFNTKPVTIDELIAEHGDRIVCVKYTLDSDEVLPTLEIKAYYEFLTTLSYFSDGKHWKLLTCTVDTAEYYPQNYVSTRESNRVLDVIRAIEKNR